MTAKQKMRLALPFDSSTDPSAEELEIIAENMWHFWIKILKFNDP